MNTGRLGSPYKSVWPQLYKAALFESDNNKVSERIAEAETALVTRARELFHSTGDDIEEKQAVDDAMYALHALRNRPQPNGHRYRAAIA
jgi:hypothetical protein